MKKINFYLILIIIFALPSYLVRFSIFGVPTTLLEILIYIAFVFSILYLVSSKKFSIFLPRGKAGNFQFSIPIILFIIAGTIGIITSPDKNVALGQFKAFIIDPILFFIVLIINFENCKIENSLKIENCKLKILMKALIFSGLVVAIHAIYQKVTGDVTLDGRVIGIFGYSPNYLSLYLTPIAVLTAGYGLLNYNKKSPSTPLYLYTFIPLSLLFILALYFSGSRAGLAVTFISISFLLILRWWDWIHQKRIVSMFLCLYVILLLVAGWWFIKPNWQLSAELGGRISASNNVRWQIWDTSGKMLATDHNWFWGVGLGNYQEYFSNFTKGWINFNEYISPNALTAHNLYLQTWFNLGLLGLISFVWLIILFFRYSKPLNLYTLPLVIMMFSILLYGILESTYWKNDLSVMFWFLIALSQIRLSNMIVKG